MKTHASGAMWESLIPHSVCYLMIMCLTTTQCNLSDMFFFFFTKYVYIYILYLCTVYISALCYGNLCIWWWLLHGNIITSHWTEMLLLLACFLFFFGLVSLHFNKTSTLQNTHRHAHTLTYTHNRIVLHLTLCYLFFHTAQWWGNLYLPCKMTIWLWS